MHNEHLDAIKTLHELGEEKVGILSRIANNKSDLATKFKEVKTIEIEHRKAINENKELTNEAKRDIALKSMLATDNKYQDLMVAIEAREALAITQEHVLNVVRNKKEYYRNLIKYYEIYGKK